MAALADYLTVSQAARQLGVNPSVVRWWVSQGHLPAEKAGRNWMIPKAALKKFERPGNPRE